MTDTVSHRGRRNALPPQVWSRQFLARPEQVREARRYLAVVLEGCPVVDDAVLCLSELAGNAVLHSQSRRPGGIFTIRAELSHGDYVRVEVLDEGGPWGEHADADSRPHGLAIVRELAVDSGTDGDALSGWIAWATLAWPPAGGCPPTVSAAPAIARFA